MPIRNRLFKKAERTGEGGGAGSYFLQDGFAQLLAIDDRDGHFIAGDAVDAQFDQTCHKVTRDKS